MKSGSSLLGAALKRAADAAETAKPRPPARPKPAEANQADPTPPVSAAKKALSGSGKSKTRDRAASAGLTSQQSDTSASLTGPAAEDRAPLAFWRTEVASDSDQSEDATPSVLFASSPENEGPGESAQADGPEVPEPPDPELLRRLPEEDREAVVEAYEQSVRDGRPEPPDPELLNGLPAEDRQALESAYQENDQAYLEALPTEQRRNLQTEDAAERLDSATTPEAALEVLEEELGSEFVDPQALLEGREELVSDHVAELLNGDNADEVAASLVALGENEEVGAALGATLDERALVNPALLNELAEHSLEGETGLLQGLRDGHSDDEEAVALLDGLEQLPETRQSLTNALENGELESFNEQFESSINSLPPAVQTAFIDDFVQSGGFDNLVERLDTGGDAPTDTLSIALRAVNQSEDPETRRLLTEQLTEVATAGNGLHFRGDLVEAASRGGAIEALRLVQENVRVNDSANATNVEFTIELAATELQNRTESLLNGVDERNGYLAVLLNEYGPFMSEEEREAAVSEYISDHDEYARLDALAPHLSEDLAALDILDNDNDGFLQIKNDLLRDLPRWGVNQEAQQDIAEQMVVQNEGGNTWLSDLNTLELDEEQRQRVGDILVQSAYTGASNAALQGNEPALDQFIDSLGSESTAELLGVTDIDEFKETLSVSKEFFKTFGKYDRDGFLRAGQRLDDELTRLGANNPRLAQQFRIGNAVVGSVLFGSQFSDTIHNPTFDSVTGTLLNGTKLANDWAKVLKTPLTAAVGEGALKSLDVLSKRASVALAVFDAYEILTTDNNVERGLATASLAGGLLTTFGTTATATGVGAVLVGAAVAGTALYAHYQQVQASNEFENDTTRKFLLHAVSDLELENADEVTDNLIRHLANADDRGSLPGRVFQGTAEALGIPPDEFFNQLAQLPEDQVLQLVEAAHLVIQDDGTIEQSNPELDQHAGKTVGGLNGARSLGVSGSVLIHQQPGHIRLATATVGPTSIDGYVEYLRRQGFEFE